MLPLKMFLILTFVIVLIIYIIYCFFLNFSYNRTYSVFYIKKGDIKLNKKTRAGDYIISFDTLMLQPVITGNKIATRVIERNGEFIIPRKPLHVVRKSCNFYGGSLMNSTNIAKLALGNRHKAPIIIAHDFGIPYIFLPTMSPNAELNSWVSYHAIENIEPHRLNSIIHLDNGRSQQVNVSATTMYRQFAFAAILEKDFLKKQRQLTRPAPYRDFEDSFND